MRSPDEAECRACLLFQLLRLLLPLFTPAAPHTASLPGPPAYLPRRYRVPLPKLAWLHSRATQLAKDQAVASFAAVAGAGPAHLVASVVGAAPPPGAAGSAGGGAGGGGGKEEVGASGGGGKERVGGAEEPAEQQGKQEGGAGPEAAGSG